MFGGSRRHRAPAQPLTKETANPNAATAAASAFMRREPSASLSSAAAAAALKARPTTPTNVAEVQTKRTARRSPSVSSIGSRDRGRPSLQRSPSVGSMSERSFRSPSPGRGGPAPQHHDVPPVPKLPLDNRASTTKSSNGGTTRNGPVLQTQPFRTASQKIKDGQSDSWYGAAKAGDPSNVRRSNLVLQTSVEPQEGRPGSISPSINFSYPRPRSASIDSHSTPSPVAENAMIYDPNSRRMVPKGQLHDSRSVSEKPVKKKKAQEVSRSGLHLSKGTVGRTKASALETQSLGSAQPTSQPESVMSSQPTTVEEYEEPQAWKQTLTEAGVASATTGVVSTSRVESPASPYIPPVPETSTATGYTEESVASRKPRATFSEDSRDGISKASDATPVASAMAEGEPVGGESAAAANLAAEDKGLVDEKPSAATTRQPGSARRERVHSESPARTAHFSTATDQLVVKHEPPSRSLSPRKSALKHRSPTRGVSPSDDGSEYSASGLGGGARSDDGTLTRKKSARVSFDQNTVVVGEAAPRSPETDSPVVASPQAHTKKPWLGIVGKNKKEHTPLDEDETMTPRPALPLFGSVREKKSKEPEERPLVRPGEHTWSPGNDQSNPFSSPPPSLSKPTDYSVESPTAQDQPARNVANISKYREPLPPVVTSVEGSGYISNSAESSENEEEEYEEPQQDMGNPVPGATQARSIVSSGEPVEGSLEHGTDQSRPVEPKVTSDRSSPTTEIAPTQPEVVSTAADNGRPVPDIFVSLPTPQQQENQAALSPNQEYFDVPGGFPSDEESPMADSGIGFANADKAGDVFKEASQLQDPLVSASSSSEVLETRASDLPPLQMNDIKEEEELTDNSSIYSDACEDLSDVDGDGFMSLDAVLTTPISKKILAKMEPSSPSSRQAVAAVSSGTPHSPDDWENAKSYWRSLSREKRLQLEAEATAEAAEDEAEAPTSKPRSKKAHHRKEENGQADAATLEKLTNGHDRSYQIQPGTKWPTNGSPIGGLDKSPKTTKSATLRDGGGGMRLRKSMRQQDVPVTDSGTSQQGHMRKSLRSGGSDRSSAVGGGLSSKSSSRPISHQPLPSKQSADGHTRSMSETGQPRRPDSSSGPTMRSNLRRRGSDSSESSFTRTRSTLGEGFGFKKSMRSSMYEPAAVKPSSGPTKGSGRFSLRSLSPAGSAFRRSSIASSPPPNGRIRQSLRSDSGDGDQQRRMHMPSFSKSSSKKARSLAGSSRFADSSDEEDRVPAFSSRFADSSDEDDVPPPSVKGKGLPRTMRNGSSTRAAAAATMRSSVPAPALGRQLSQSPDLPDSSDDEKPQPKQQPTVNGIANGTTNGKSSLQRSGSGRGNMIAANHNGVADLQQELAARPAHKRRGSFMSNILRRKKGSGGKISKGMSESAARKDTPLERSTEELSMIRTNSNNSKSRLQRRGPSWPFPDGEEKAAGAAPEQVRPSTSGGPAVSTSKTKYLTRRSASYTYNGTTASALTTADDDPIQPADTAASQSGKKKKFGTLRKMFRLQD